MRIEVCSALPYVVYSHRINDIIFYIGSGKINRPFQIDEITRTYEWHKFRDGRDISIVIEGYYPDRDSAFAAEYAMIRKVRPTANIKGMAPIDAKALAKQELDRQCRAAPYGSVLIVNIRLIVPSIEDAAGMTGLSVRDVERSLQSGCGFGENWDTFKLVGRRPKIRRRKWR